MKPCNLFPKENEQKSNQKFENMETTKTVLTSGGRITVIDALRGFSLIGICLIHSMQHFGAMGTMNRLKKCSRGRER